MKTIRKFVAYTTLIFGLSAYNIASYADNFDYATSPACKAKMQEYQQTAQKRMRNYEPFTPDWEGFANMLTFLRNIDMQSYSREDCQNGSCTVTFPASCALVGSPAWKNQVIPLLTRELSPYLPNMERYNPNLGVRASFIVHCSGTLRETNWASCQITRGN